MKIRQNIVFFGTVQGVGFRWNARNYASLLGLTGWVCNMDDGTVQMEVQGEKDLIDKLIELMGQQVFVEIEAAVRKDIPLRSDEWAFIVEE